MFGIGLPELILILGIALIVVGPEKLPEMAKAIAKLVVDLKKAASSVGETLHEEMKGDLGQDLDLWKQKPGDAQPGLPSTTAPEPAAPEADAGTPPDSKPTEPHAGSGEEKVVPEGDVAAAPQDSEPAPGHAAPETKEEKKEEKQAG